MNDDKLTFWEELRATIMVLFHRSELESEGEYERGYQDGEKDERERCIEIVDARRKRYSERIAYKPNATETLHAQYSEAREILDAIEGGAPASREVQP